MHNIQFHRLFFTAMLFMAMRFKFYSAWKASECAFITLGFGVYPENCHPKPGCGPTTNYNMIYKFVLCYNYLKLIILKT